MTVRRPQKSEQATPWLESGAGIEKGEIRSRENGAIFNEIKFYQNQG